MKNITLQNYTSLSQKHKEEILELRNQKEIREFSLKSEPITLKEHLAWIEKLKSDREKCYYGVIFEDEIIGGVHLFDISSKATWGVFFKKETNPQLKTLVVLYFFDSIFATFATEAIYAEILSKNTNAISFNNNFGFKEIAITNDIIKLELSYEMFEKKKKSILLRGVVKKMKQFNFIIEA